MRASEAGGGGGGGGGHGWCQAQELQVASVSRVVELSAQRDSALSSARRTSEKLREAEVKLDSMQQSLTAVHGEGGECKSH
eukprot:243694-Hanusia_phi.AAC.1